MELANINIQNEILNFLTLDKIIMLYDADKKYIDGLSCKEFKDMIEEYEWAVNAKECSTCGFRRFEKEDMLIKYAKKLSKMYSYLYTLDNKRIHTNDALKWLCKKIKNDFVERNIIKIVKCKGIQNIFQCECNNYNKLYVHPCYDNICKHFTDNMRDRRLMVRYYNKMKANNEFTMFKSIINGMVDIRYVTDDGRYSIMQCFNPDLHDEIKFRTPNKNDIVLSGYNLKHFCNKWKV